MFTIKYFEEKFKSYSNAQLLHILENPKGYQTIALNAARSEIDARQLNSDEVNEAKQVLKIEKEELISRNAKRDRIKSKIISSGDEVIETISPFQGSLPIVSKVIVLVAILYTSLAILNIARNYDTFQWIIFGDNNEKFAYTTNLFPLLLLILGTAFFWFKKRMGWIILIIYTSHLILVAIYGIYHAFTVTSILFYQSPGSLFLGLLFYSGLMFTLNREDIREVYSIKKNQIAGPIFIGILLGLFLIMLII